MHSFRILCQKFSSSDFNDYFLLEILSYIKFIGSGWTKTTDHGTSWRSTGSRSSAISLSTNGCSNGTANDDEATVHDADGTPSRDAIIVLLLFSYFWEIIILILCFIYCTHIWQNIRSVEIIWGRIDWFFGSTL